MREIMDDCEFYQKKLRRCTALKDTYCAQGPCSFYKPAKGRGKEKYEQTTNKSR